MSAELSVLLVILASASVTFLPRILPFVIVRSLNLPPAFLKWLSYIPVCLLAALIMQGLIRPTGGVPEVDWRNLAVVVPTLLAAMWTRSLLATVLTGVAAAALLRFLF